MRLTARARWPVQLRVHTRRFRCDSQRCPRRVFVERFPGVLEGRRRGQAQRVPPRRAPPLQRLLRRSPQHLTPEEQEQVDSVLAANPKLADAYRLRQRFREVVAARNLEGVDAWTVAAQRSLCPEFRTLARGFRHHWQAILAALGTPWSTGPCEGQNTRVKLIKRLGYGRAKTDLLRQRVLHRFPVAS